MVKQRLLEVVKALNAARARYLVAGGLAVIAHGHVRLTVDLDLALAMDQANLQAAIGALEKLGYRPRVPVPLSDFLDEQKRREWIEQKGALVFTLLPARQDDPPVDFFLKPEFDFEDEWGKATPRVIDGVSISVVSLETLVAMKTGTGRPKDEDDLLQLRRIQRLEAAGERPS
jgi:hypothetical protein